MAKPDLHRLGAALFAVLSLGYAAGAMAQTPMDEPLDEHAAKRVDRLEKAMKEIRAIVFQGRETGTPIVVQPADTQGQLAAQGDKINDINQTLARMNGELEVIKHDLDQSRHETADLREANATLRDRLTALEKSVKDVMPPPPPPPGTGPAATLDPAGAFAAAKTAFDAGDNAAAEAGFRDYVDHDGDSPGGPEARFYLAKTLMARRAWPEAATADIGAIRGWPHTRWAPEALVDLSKSLLALGKRPDACQALDELTRRYPKAPPALTKAAADERAQAQCP